MMKKMYNEFNEVERKAIDKMQDAFFIAEMSDDYNATKREEKAALERFNKEFDYNFTIFAANFYGHSEKQFLA